MNEWGQKMNHKQRITLANAIEAIRPDWQQTGIVSQLHILDNNWAGNDATLAAHAMAIASSPAAQTPAAFNVMRPNTIQDPTPEGFKEDNCYICGRPKTACQRMQDWEIAHGVPDPHVFETEAEAIANTAPRTAEQKLALRQQIRTLIKRADDVK